MPRTKGAIHPARSPRISYETCHCSGGRIRCLSCGYLGRSDVVKIHKRRAHDRSLERCPECKSLRLVCLEETLIMTIETNIPEPPNCPEHGPMTVHEITHDGRLLGFLWWCETEGCDECEDYDPAVYGEQVPQFLETEEDEASPESEPLPTVTGPLSLFEEVPVEEASDDL